MVAQVDLAEFARHARFENNLEETTTTSCHPMANTSVIKAVTRTGLSRIGRTNLFFASRQVRIMVFHPS